MSVKNYFTPEGGFSSLLKNYRYRPVQAEVSSFIFDAMEEYTPAAVEAPTGSGKTLSYLTPVFELGRRAVISTKTKQLMSQIVNKDIKPVEQLFDRKMNVAVFKGRKNYICTNRFYANIYSNSNMFPDVIEWFDHMSQYDIIEIPQNMFGYEAVERMTADRYQCKGSKCEFYAGCSFYMAKDYANSCDIVVTNHHLLMSDFSLKTKSEHAGILDFADHIIMDEAHSVPDIFPLFAGSELSLRAFLSLLKENKEKFSPKEQDMLLGAYNNITMSLPDSRVDFSKVRAKADDFMNTCTSLFKGHPDEDISETYDKLFESYSPMTAEEEGVRLCEMNGSNVSFRFIPLSAADRFREGVKNSCLSPVFISATLATMGNFNYFLSELGYDKGEVSEMKADPVFDLKEKGRIYVPENKISQQKAYIETVRGTKGSVLIICNSIRRMYELYEMLSEFSDKNVYVQHGTDITEISRDEEAVFIGCAVFREGVDFTHTNLKCVILDKLPFEYFGDAFFKSRAEKVEKDGGNSFMDYSLPRAVIFFKQAVGRLLRHEDDKGLWVVFDDRLYTKNYGRYFLEVLNGADRLRTIDEALEYLEECDAEA